MWNWMSEEVRVRSVNYSLQVKPWLAAYFCKWISLLHSLSSCLHIDYSSFMLLCQNLVVLTETMWPANPEVFTIWSFTEESVPNSTVQQRHQGSHDFRPGGWQSLLWACKIVTYFSTFTQLLILGEIIKKEIRMLS